MSDYDEEIQEKIEEAGENLIHKNCGGTIVHGNRSYEYEREDGSIEKQPMLVCRRCGSEIQGDAEIE
jgi:hypothetical protein